MREEETSVRFEKWQKKREWQEDSLDEEKRKKKHDIWRVFLSSFKNLFFGFLKFISNIDFLFLLLFLSLS